MRSDGSADGSPRPTPRRGCLRRLLLRSRSSWSPSLDYSSCTYPGGSSKPPLLESWWAGASAGVVICNGAVGASTVCQLSVDSHRLSAALPPCHRRAITRGNCGRSGTLKERQSGFGDGPPLAAVKPSGVPSLLRRTRALRSSPTPILWRWPSKPAGACGSGRPHPAGRPVPDGNHRTAGPSDRAVSPSAERLDFDAEKNDVQASATRPGPRAAELADGLLTHRG